LLFFRKFRVVSVCFGLIRNSSVCFGCFDTGSKHRNKPKILVFGFTKQTETQPKQILYRYIPRAWNACAGGAAHPGAAALPVRALHVQRDHEEPPAAGSLRAPLRLREGLRAAAGGGGALRQNQDQGGKCVLVCESVQRTLKNILHARTYYVVFLSLGKCWASALDRKWPKKFCLNISFNSKVLDAYPLTSAGYLK
jgi:hypothetical protein